MAASDYYSKIGVFHDVSLNMDSITACVSGDELNIIYLQATDNTPDTSGAIHFSSSDTSSCLSVASPTKDTSYILTIDTSNSSMTMLQFDFSGSSYTST